MAKLTELRREIREKNSSNSKFRNKHFETIDSSSADSGPNDASPPKLTKQEPF